MVKSSFISAALVSLVAANPIEIRQTGVISKEFSQGGCRPILFAWARGSTEVGNMGTVVGPPTSDGLKKVFGDSNVATEGVDYAALLSTNVLPGGTDAISKNLFKSTVTSMASQCPNSIIVTGGYSQGSAVNHRAIEELPQSVKDRIVGTVLYGDTQKVQDNNQIPTFPQDKTKIICNPGDLVCTGSLVILPPHLAYGARADEGVNFLAQKIKAAQAKNKARNIQRAIEAEMDGVAASTEAVEFVA